MRTAVYTAFVWRWVSGASCGLAFEGQLWFEEAEEATASVATSRVWICIYVHQRVAMPRDREQSPCQP